MTTCLSLTDVSSGYEGNQVLANVSLEIETGQCVAIIGPNGHGKTTLLRTISGLLALREGTISLEGRDISHLPPHEIAASGIAHVPQGDLLFAEMTVLENLRMGAHLPGAGVNYEQRLAEIFELLPVLDERRHQYASTLSGGERRMVGIARGLMMSAKILMLDEPSLGLAPIIIEQVYTLIEHLTAIGKTVLIVEENALRVAEKAHRLHLLEEGSFVWSGSGQELLARPQLLETYLGA